MEKLIPVGKVFFVLAFLGLGIKHFIIQDFVTGRAPALPGDSIGRLIWAYITGAFFIPVSIVILFKKNARSIVLTAGFIILVWAFFRQVVFVAEDSFLGPKWTHAGKALVFFGGILIISGTMPQEQKQNGTFSKIINLNSEFFTIGRICLGLFLVITGIQHFIYTKFVASLFPEWFPGDFIFWTYFGGIALVSGGLGILIPRTAQLASLLVGIMVFSWFWIIHIPRTFKTVSDGIAVFEALAVSGIALILAGVLNKPLKIKSVQTELNSFH